MTRRDHIGKDYEVLALGQNQEPGRVSNGSPQVMSGESWYEFLAPEVQTPQLPEQETLPIATIVDGKYQILGIAGKGGMGVVYAAQHIHLNRVVALKMLKKEYCTDDLVFRRFQKEAQAASLLHHPNIIKVHDFVMKAGDKAYLVMDFLEGSSLLREIGPLKPLPLDRFHNIFIQACDALAHAHKWGLVHRDIKPSNLLLSERDGRKDHLTIVDFGLVKLMTVLDDQRLTTTNTLIGSPLYMSPEQCTRRKVDHRSDIYSLGCSMYEALTGYLPHHGATPLETFCKHVTEDAQPLNVRNANAHVPYQLERVILKALSKDPSDRQQSMEELRDDLERCPAEPSTVSSLKELLKVTSTNTPSINSTIRLAPRKSQEKSSRFLPIAMISMMAAVLSLLLLLHIAVPFSHQPAPVTSTSSLKSALRPHAKASIALQAAESSKSAISEYATGFPDENSLPLNKDVSEDKHSTAKKSRANGHRGNHWRYYHYYYYR